MSYFKILIFLLLISCCADSVSGQIPKGGMAGVEEIKFKSSVNNQDYVLYVKLPDGYANEPTRRYPVIYATDGQWSFPLMMEIRSGLLYDNLTPEMIYVGIAWPDNFFVNRIRDFFPTKTEQFPNAGGAEDFLNVIKLEIVKSIEAKYRTDKINNGLYGTSAGGFFALYALFHEPGLFNRYIVCSPSLEYNDAAAFKYEKLFSEKAHTLNARLFLSSGGYEEEVDPFTFNNFINQLKASKYTGLEMESLVIEKMGHVSANPYAIGRGLQFVFNNIDTIVEISLLDKYVGQYEMGLTFVRIENSLYAIVGEKQLRLHATTNENFYLPGFNGSLEFMKDDKGKVTGIKVNLADQSFLAKRLD